MTERQGAGQGMRRSSDDPDALEQLAGSVAHDLTNMLTIVTGYSAYLAEDVSLTQEQRQGLDQISQAGQRAVSLTDQLLAFSRQEVPRQTELDLNRFVAAIEPTFRTKSGEKIAVTIVQDQALGLVKADPSTLQQIILNLVVSAGAAMRDGGRLTIEAKNVDLAQRSGGTHERALAPGSYVRLSISLPGGGVADRAKTPLREPTFATRKKEQEKEPGISTVQELVEQMGGAIRVQNDDGHDPSVQLYLPRIEKPARLSAVEALPAGKAAGNETILVAEDEAGLRKLVCLTLRQKGYLVLEADDGEEAARIGSQHQGPLHLFLTDAAMPRMGGLEAMKRLVAQRPDLQVLFMSGYTVAALLSRGLYEAGIPFMQKPFSYEELAVTVRQLLDARVGGLVPSPSTTPRS